MTSIKCVRTQHVITLNPNKVNPGEELYIEVAKLKRDSCLVPVVVYMETPFNMIIVGMTALK